MGLQQFPIFPQAGDHPGHIRGLDGEHEFLDDPTRLVVLPAHRHDDVEPGLQVGKQDLLLLGVVVGIGVVADKNNTLLQDRPPLVPLLLEMIHELGNQVQPAVDHDVLIHKLL